MKTLREDFETWAKERGHPLCDVIPSYGPASSMPKTELRFSDIAWETFQAASDLAAKREREDVDGLLTALKDLSKMYTHAWDLVDGGLTMMGESIPLFEKRHKAASKAIERFEAAAIRARDGGTS